MLRISKIELRKKNDYWTTHPIDLTTCYSAQFSKLKVLLELRQPSLLDIGLFNVPVQIDVDDYITVERNDGSLFFGGFVTQTPEYQFLGDNGTPGGGWAHTIKCCDDSYLLNTKGIPLGVPPYVGMTHRAILVDLANRIMSAGVYGDGSIVFVQEVLHEDNPLATGFTGATEAFYVVDPKKKWSEIATEFSEADNARFWFTGLGRFWYEPIVPDDRDISENNRSEHDYQNYLYLTDYREHLNYDNGLFTHGNFKLVQQEQEYRNDVIVIGADSPSFPVNEEHVADGVTSLFRLKEIPYGTEETTLIEEDWSGASIDKDKWEVASESNDTFELLDGFLNVTGALTDDHELNYIRSNSAIEMAGEIIARAGEITFEGVNPLQTIYQDYGDAHGYVGALFPEVAPTTNCAYGFQINISSTDAQIQADIGGTLCGVPFNIEKNKSYIPRICLSIDEPYRITNQYYQEYEDVELTLSSNGRIRFELEVYDISTPENVTYTVLHTAEIQDIPATLLFYPVVESNFHLLICNTAVTRPVQIEATLTSAVEKDVNNKYQQYPVKIGSSLDGADAILQMSDNVCSLVFYDTKSDGTTSNTPKLGEKLSLRYWAKGKAQYHVRDVWGVRGKRSCTADDYDPNDPDNFIIDAVTSSSNPSSQTTIVFDAGNPFFNTARDYYATCLAQWAGYTVTIINSEKNVLTVVSGETDGKIPAAKVPGPSTPIRLFRSTKKIFDDGVRSTIVTDLNPLPRTDREAELAAKAYLWDHTTPKYEGSYTGILGDIIKDVPSPGARVLIDVRHFNSLNPNYNENEKDLNNSNVIVARLEEVTLEEYGSIWNTESKQLEAAVQYSLSFKTGERLKRYLNKLLLNRRGVLIGTSLSSVKDFNPHTESYNTIPDLASVAIIDHTATTLTVRVDNTSDSLYVEVKEANDSNWGESVNYVTSAALSPSASTTLTLDRTKIHRRSALYFRLTTGSLPTIYNSYSRHSSMLYVDYPKVPVAPSLIETKLDSNITFKVNLPTSTYTVPATRFNDGAARTFYLGDFAGLEIRDKYSNTLYKGSGFYTQLGTDTKNVSQSPAFGTLPETLYQKDYLFSITIDAAMVLAFDPQVLVDGDGNSYQRIPLSGTPLDMWGRNLIADQYKGYKLHIGFSTGVYTNTILGVEIVSDNLILVQVDPSNPLTLLEEGQSIYVTVSNTYSADNAGTYLTIAWPRNLNARTYNDFYINVYNTLNEINYFNPITAVGNTGTDGAIQFTFTDPLCSSETEAAYFQDSYKMEDGTIVYNQLFAVDDWVALVPSTPSGKSAVAYAKITNVDLVGNKITINSTEASTGFTDIVGGYLRKLLTVENQSPTVSNITVKTEGFDPPKNSEVTWEGADATYYNLRLSTTGSARVLRINHVGAETETTTLSYSALTDEEKTSELGVSVLGFDDFGEASSSNDTLEPGDTDVPAAPLITSGAKNLEITITVGPPANTTGANWKGVSLISLDVADDAAFTTGVKSYSIQNTKGFKQVHTVGKDGTYYYRARATNSFGAGAYATGNISVYYGTTTGDYTNDWYGVFFAKEGIVGRQNVSNTPTATRNPAVFLLAANDFDGKKIDIPEEDDPILPAWTSGDFCIADDVQTAMKNPAFSTSYLKFVTSTNGTRYLSVKGPTIQEGNITASAFITGGYPNDPHVVINNDGITGWAGAETAENLTFAFAATDFKGLIGTTEVDIYGGEIWAKRGVIGGWKITNYLFESGNLTKYVGLSSDPDGVYALWAGDNDAADAPFSVQRDGKLFLGDATKVGDYLEWDGENLNVQGIINVTQGGVIGGWQALEIQQGTDVPVGWKKRLESGSGVTYVALDSGTTDTTDPNNPYPGNASNSYAIWLGGNVASTAPFRIKRSGAFHAGDTDNYIDWNGTALTVNGVTIAGTNTISSGATDSILIGDPLTGHIRINQHGITGWDGPEPTNITSPTDPNWRYLQFALATTGWTIGDSKLTVSMGAGDVWAKGGIIGGWLLKEEIGGTAPNQWYVKRLESGSGSSYVGLDSGTTYSLDPNNPDGTYAIWAGAAVASSAVFSVSRAGALKSTSGTIGGWVVNSTGIQNKSSSPQIVFNGDDTNPYISIGATAPTLVSSTPTGTGIMITKGALYGLIGNAQRFKLDANTGEVFAEVHEATSGFVAGIRTAQHVVISIDGIAGWAGAESFTSTAGLNFCISNRATPFTVTVDAVDYSITQGTLFARNGIFSGTVHAQGGFIGNTISDIPIDNQGLRIGTTGRIASGTTEYATGTGFWIGYDVDTYKMRIGDPTTDPTTCHSLVWDGDNLNIYGVINSREGGTIGGFEILEHRLHSGSAGTYVALDSGTPGCDFAFWAGAIDPALAAFSVSRDGTVNIATEINIGTGSVLGGWTINANALVSGTGTGHVELNSSSIGTYSIWAGDNDATLAPFSVTRSGDLYIGRTTPSTFGSYTKSYKATGASESYSGIAMYAYTALDVSTYAATLYVHATDAYHAQGELLLYNFDHTASPQVYLKASGSSGTGCIAVLDYATPATEVFSVNYAGDIKVIKGANYTWPSAANANPGGNTALFLQNDGSGVLTWVSAGVTGVTGSGTVGTIPIFTGSTVNIGDSSLSQVTGTDGFKANPQYTNIEDIWSNCVKTTWSIWSNSVFIGPWATDHIAMSTVDISGSCGEEDHVNYSHLNWGISNAVLTGLHIPSQDINEGPPPSYPTTPFHTINFKRGDCLFRTGNFVKGIKVWDQTEAPAGTLAYINNTTIDSNGIAVADITINSSGIMVGPLTGAYGSFQSFGIGFYSGAFNETTYATHMAFISNSSSQVAKLGRVFNQGDAFLNTLHLYGNIEVSSSRMDLVNKFKVVASTGNIEFINGLNYNWPTALPLSIETNGKFLKCVTSSSTGTLTWEYITNSNLPIVDFAHGGLGISLPADPGSSYAGAMFYITHNSPYNYVGILSRPATPSILQHPGGATSPSWLTPSNTNAYRVLYTTGSGFTWSIGSSTAPTEGSFLKYTGGTVVWGASTGAIVPAGADNSVVFLNSGNLYFTNGVRFYAGLAEMNTGGSGLNTILRLGYLASSAPVSESLPVTIEFYTNAGSVRSAYIGKAAYNTGDFQIATNSAGTLKLGTELGGSFTEYLSISLAGGIRTSSTITDITGSYGFNSGSPSGMHTQNNMYGFFGHVSTSTAPTYTPTETNFVLANIDGGVVFNVNNLAGDGHFKRGFFLNGLKIPTSIPSPAVIGQMYLSGTVLCVFTSLGWKTVNLI